MNFRTDDGNEVSRFIHQVSIKHQKEVDNAIMLEIKSMATENGIKDEYILNEKAILSALEKQMPKKPVIPFDSIDRNYECPTCPHRVDKTQQYCDKCGQKLDWGEENG
jgi:hypothetical protein